MRDVTLHLTFTIELTADELDLIAKLMETFDGMADDEDLTTSPAFEGWDRKDWDLLADMKADMRRIQNA